MTLDELISDDDPDPWFSLWCYWFRFAYWFRSIPRAIRFWFQRRTRGWDDSDLWSLDAATARFMLPRLRRFRQTTIAHPYGLDPCSWDWILGEIEWYLGCVADCNWPSFGKAFDDPVAQRIADEDVRRYQRAEKALADYFTAMWD